MQGRNPNPRRIDPPFIGTGKTKLLKNPICKLHPELVKKQVLGVFRLKGGHKANRWFLYISELAQKAQPGSHKNTGNWQKFLTTASRFYKSYDFDDQLLIYIQRPDAVACADIETWNNKMHRWVNAGSNAIGLIRKGTGGRPYIQNVHDVSVL